MYLPMLQSNSWMQRIFLKPSSSFHIKFEISPVFGSLEKNRLRGNYSMSLPVSRIEGLNRYLICLKVII